jgi:aquaporin rerated protein, other eukaryote
VNHHFPHYFWIYFLGPLLGSLLASGFYKLINSLRYETCNPGQDYNEIEAQNGKHRLVSEESREPTSSAHVSHQRNLSDATAVNHDYHVSNNAPPQRDISAVNPSANMQPVHEKVEHV